MALATVLLAPSIRPGRTVVPVDILEAAEPFRSLPPAPEVHNPLPSDAAFQFLGWYSWMGRELRTGHIPQWNPEVLGGVALEPNGFVSPYYPPMWLVRGLATFDAYNAFVWFHLVLAAAGAYAFGRRLGAHPLAAGVAGAAAMTAGMWIHLSTHLVHLGSMTWIGLALAAAHGAATERRGRWVAALAVTIGLTWLAAGTQFAYFATLAVAGYGVALALFRDLTGERTRQRLGGVVAVSGGVVLGLALAAPLLLPGIAARDGILRDTEPVTSMATTHLPGADLLRALVPDWRGGDGETDWKRTGNPEFDVDTPFVGVATLVLAAAAVGRARRRRDVALALGGVAVVTVLAFTDPVHRFLYAVVPSYDQFRVGGRWVAVLPGFAAPLAAVGLSALLDRETHSRRWFGVAVAATSVALLCLGLAVAVDASAPQRYMAIRLLVAALPLAVVAGIFLRPRRLAFSRALALALVTVAVVGEAAFHTARWYGAHREANAVPALASARAASATGGRLVRLSTALTQIPPLAADVPLFYGLSDSSGWAVIFPRDYDRYLRTIEDYGDFAKATNVAPPLTQAVSLQSPLLDALDVRTVLVDPGVTASVPFPVVARDGPVRVLRRPSSGPAVLVPDAAPVNEKEMWRAVAEPSWRPDQTAAVRGLTRAVRGAAGQVERTDATADTERYRVDAPAGGLLRVSGRYDKGWTARIDGEKARVFKADGIFRAVVIPPGRHVVDWRYRNPPEELGRKVALLTLVALAGLAVVPGLRTRRRAPGEASPR